MSLNTWIDQFDGSPEELLRGLLRENLEKHGVREQDGYLVEDTRDAVYPYWPIPWPPIKDGNAWVRYTATGDAAVLLAAWRKQSERQDADREQNATNQTE